MATPSWRSSWRGYWVLASFVGMLWLLMSDWTYRVPAAIVLAVLASFCCVQGLLLWPVGLLCLAWPKDRQRSWLGWWLAAAIVATGAY